MRFMMLVKANKDYEAGAPPSPELMAAVAKLADEATARGVMVSAGRTPAQFSGSANPRRARENVGG